jgi:cytochrome P450
MAIAVQRPESDIDLWSDEAIRDPYPLWEEMRELGPAIYLPSHDFWALPRYEQVKQALGDWQSFTSTKGVMMNEPTNRAQGGNVICSDPPLHKQLRDVLRKPLTPGVLREVELQVQEEADKLVSDLVERGEFEVVGDLAKHIPVSIVASWVGLPDDGRERMLEWAAAAFDCVGPENERMKVAYKVFAGGLEFSNDPTLPTRLKPGGWAAGLWEAADRGEIPREQCPSMLSDYWIPALDTTIHGMTSTIWLFSQNPDQWDIVRAEPELIPHAINEALRLESPITTFSRVATVDYEIEDVTIPAGARVLMMFGSANRDPRKYPDPERFDVRRRPADQLAFGHGKHKCVGMPLARMEITAVMKALVEKVERFELREMERAENNILHGIARLELTVS